MRSIVAERGQVTIPKSLRDCLGIKPGTILEFFEEGGRLVAVKVDEKTPLMKFTENSEKVGVPMI